MSKKRVTRIYIGNQFCHNLFPRKELLFQVLEKALENNLAVTLAFTYIRDHLLEEIDELLQELEVWCQGKEQEVSKQQVATKEQKGKEETAGNGNYCKRLGDAYTFAGKTTLKTSVGSSVK